jgi:transposase
MPEKLYTTGEVAKIFGVSYAAVRNLLRRYQMDVGASSFTQKVLP